LGSGSFGKVF
jgi:calcium-dependent protein kinase